MARKKNNDEGGGYSWMDTYGDMVTLLLTFFIMLFSMSSVDSEKWEVLVKAFSRNKDDNTSQIVMIPEGDGDSIAPSKGVDDKFSGDVDSTNNIPSDLEQLAQMLQEFLEENNMEESVSVEAGQDSVYLRFDNNLLFDGDSARLRDSCKSVLDYLGSMFKSLDGQIEMVRINGHTADIPGSPINDWELSCSRAANVASYFAQGEVNGTKLAATGFGNNQPIADNTSLEGQAQNRRVDIQVLGYGFEDKDTAALYDILKRSLEVDLLDDSPLPEVIPPAAEVSTASGEANSTPADTPVEPKKPDPPVNAYTDEDVRKAMEQIGTKTAADGAAKTNPGVAAAKK